MDGDEAPKAGAGARGGPERNSDVAATWRYHNGTKHSPASVAADAGELDSANKPIPYKVYENIPPLPLPSEFPPSSVGALQALDGETPHTGRSLPDLQTLARICFYSNGVTKYLKRHGAPYPFRAAACTGALYQIEIYLVCGPLPDLAAGVYHFAAHDNALRLLRVGDYRDVLMDASGREPAIAAAPVIAVCTSTFWRNAWKYEGRAYRHAFWDAGTVLANLLAVAAGQEVPVKVVVGFADQPVTALLDIDPEREVAVGLVALGWADEIVPPSPPVAPLHLPVTPLSASEVDYPEIAAMHGASMLATGADAAAWRPANARGLPTDGRGSATRRQLPAVEQTPAPPIEEVIRQRGSSRRFDHRPIATDQISLLLQAASRPLPADFLNPADAHLSDVYVIVNAVDGVESGTYAYHQAHRDLELLQRGEFRERAGFLALEQDLAADAAVNIYFLARLDPILAEFGNRGYRGAQLDAAISGGRVYLAAYALGLGATGLTFYDDEVTDFFSPHAAGKSVMFLMAVGYPLRPGDP